MGGNMRLRNKETGEVGDLIGSVTSCPYISIGVDFHDGDPKTYHYNSIAELNEHWEDYAPAEPLIKDEKVRKAVRSWADANYLKWACYSLDGRFYDKTTDHEITFKFYSNRSDIPECKLLTIAELCGEEEE